MSLKNTALSRLVEYRRARMKHTAALAATKAAEGTEGHGAAIEALDAAEAARNTAHNELLQVAELYDRALNPP